MSDRPYWIVGGESEYQNAVDLTVDSVMESLIEYPEDYDDVHEAIDDTVDYHNLVTYNVFAYLFVLRHSPAFEYGLVAYDYEPFVEGVTNYRRYLQQLAYVSFRADVTEEVMEQLDPETSDWL
jgi:hypothetical protein